MDQRGTISTIADELLRDVLDANPVGASVLGFRDREDRLPDHSEAGAAARRERLAGLAARAAAVDPAGLDPTDRVTRAVVRQLAAAEQDQLAANTVEYTITNMFFAPVVELFVLLPMVGLAEPAHADGYLARLARIPDVLTTLAERHRAGAAAGRVPVRRLVESAVAYLDRYSTQVDDDPLRRPRPPAGGAGFAERRDRLLAEVVRPAVARYREVLAAELAPVARPDDRPGLCWLPGGEGSYAGLVRAHTTTERSPEELHQTGLEIVEGLNAEYAQIGARVFGTSDPAEIRHRLRADPALRWRDGDELIEAARATIRRAEQAAPAWFRTLPGQQCTVEPVPEAEAPGAAAAYYLPPALDGSRPGTYFANTHQAGERSRASYEAVAFHEAVPGHHFQLTRAQELADLPPLRRLSLFNAYGEGWGLYAERLADEMGLYSDDVARLGMLSEDAMRAARLVVDTGLHAKGWHRRQVVDYLLANTAVPAVEIESETDRYIAAPGQALSYMVGRLEIQRIRAAARAELGDRFDIRAFHDTVLGAGSLPLTVLAEVVGDWVSGVVSGHAR